MIQQLHYGSTPRYNFLPAFEEMELPKRLIELSLSTMRNAKGRYFQPYDIELAPPFPEKPTPDELANLKSRAFSTLLMPLTPIQDGTPIVGIDVSSIRIGETETGIICAVRGVVVWNEKRRYRFLRLGPFPFHVTEENRIRLFSELGKNLFSGLTGSISTSTDTQILLCNLVERWVRESVSYVTSRSIILWDGSLTAGTLGNPVSPLFHCLRLATRNLNSVLAFSKATTLSFLGRKITELVSGHDAPCLLRVEDLPLSISKTVHMLGRIYAAKLATGGCSFRLDIDRTLSDGEAIAAVERLLGNEILYQGYPETLRLAHIHSTFTANDVIGIQSFIARKYGLKVSARHNIRKTLFGPYGTGLED